MPKNKNYTMVIQDFDFSMIFLLIPRFVDNSVPDRLILDLTADLEVHFFEILTSFLEEIP
jgi:hypothetical protein